jgi:hypothetical protein
MAGAFTAMYYMWFRYGKLDLLMIGNGLLAGLVAITAPSGFVNPVASVIIGGIAGVLVCLSVEFVERVLKVDDPVGAISVHGANGLWGVISLGLFADGKSNYGGSWNGVSGSVTGLFYGDAGQLVAQLVGVSTLIGFVFALSFVFYLLVNATIGQRVSGGGRDGRPGRSGDGFPVLSGVPAKEAMTTLIPSPSITAAPAPHQPLPVPWRDPHTVSRETLREHVAKLEQACLDNPESPDLWTCLGMAYAMDFRIYPSYQALENARELAPGHFWAQFKYAELHYRLRALPRAEQEMLRALELAADAAECFICRRHL